jgi:hypothetical protein
MFVLHDRDASFTAAFDKVFQAGRRQGRPLRCSGAADELDHGALDWQLSA